MTRVIAFNIVTRFDDQGSAEREARMG
jgi:hypothetical protein